MPRRSLGQPCDLWATTASVLRTRPSLGVAAVLGSLMHAAGHAFLAGAAGLLARSLAGPPAGVAILSNWGGGALALALAGVVAAIVKLGGGALSSWAEARIASAAGGAVRLAVLDCVLALSPGHDDHTCVNRGADRLTALTSHVVDVERGVAHGVLAEARAVIALVPLAVLLVALAPRLAGSAVLALVAFGVLAFSLRRAFKRAHARASASASALVDAADEAVRHAELWATYGAARRIRAHVAGIGRAIADESASVRVRASLLSSMSEVLGALALALVLLLAARGLFGVDHATVVPFAIVFFMAYKPLRDLVEARLERAKGQAALEAAMRDDARRPDPAPVKRKTWKPAPLVLENVVTTHGKHAPVSIAIPAGSVVALVGPTGVGKTSLLRAMLGLAPASGAMRWGEARIDANGVGPSERPFAWVPQDAPIVGDTLAINVGLGRADHSTLVCGCCGSAEGGTQDDAQVPDPAPYLERLGASHLAKLGDARLSRALSGGERQWIAVARALASGQPALLLDEPTSALDPASEKKLLAALAALRGELTIVIVTHRPAPIAIADVVLRLRDLRERVPCDSHGLEHVDDGTRAHDDAVAVNELAVDDVRAGARGEA